MKPGKGKKRFPQVAMTPQRPLISPEWHDTMHIEALIRAIALTDSPPAQGGITGEVSWARVVDEVRQGILGSEDRSIKDEAIGLAELADNFQEHGTVNHDQYTNWLNTHHSIPATREALADALRSKQEAFGVIPIAELLYELPNLAEFVSIWLKNSPTALRICIGVAMLEALGVDPAVLDERRPKYMSLQRPRNRHGKDYKAFRKFVKEPKWPQLDDEKLLKRAKVWVLARIVFESTTMALRHHYREPLLDSGDRRVGWWYTELQKFDKALK